MTIKEILGNEEFKQKVRNGEISKTFLKEVRGGYFDPETVQRLVFTKFEELSEYDKKIVDGTFEYDIAPPKIDITGFKRKFGEFLKSRNVDSNEVKLLTKELVKVYRNIKKIFNAEFCVESLDLAIAAICTFDNKDDPTLDIVEINSADFDWQMENYILFAWSEDDGAFYLKILGEDIGSVWWLDHEETDLKFVSMSCTSFLDLILSKK